MEELSSTIKTNEEDDSGFFQNSTTMAKYPGEPVTLPTARKRLTPIAEKKHIAIKVQTPCRNSGGSREDRSPTLALTEDVIDMV